jgi:hypothetical protein
VEVVAEVDVVEELVFDPLPQPVRMTATATTATIDLPIDPAARPR